MTRARSPVGPTGSRRPSAILVVAVATLMLASSVLFATAPAHARSAAMDPNQSQPARATAAPGSACGSSPLAPGDLIVGPGTGPCIIQASGLQTTYTQSGNVTVLPGGELIIRNITFSIRQYISNSGTPMQRLSHVYAFRDEGTVQVWNATLTTDATASNPYLKLALNVTGQMSVWNSSLEFPGWITVYGVGGNITLDRSVIEGNPAAESPAYQTLGSQTVGDTAYAASLSVQAGAHLALINSNYNDTYADNTVSNGMPAAIPLSDTTAFQLSPSSGRTLDSFETPTASLNLLQDWLYPDGIYSGNVTITYSTTSTVIAGQVSLTYEGIAFPLGSVNFRAGSNLQALIVFSPSLISAINADGMLEYLNATGSFAGTSSSQISLTLDPTATGTVNVSVVQIGLSPLLDYNLQETGSGTSLVSAGSTFDVNWNATPASPISGSPPFPWESNKLLIEDGATADLANPVIPAVSPGASANSAFLPDSTSNVYLFRWAAFPVTGRGGIAVPGALASAYYGTSGGNNGTVNALNNLSSSNPTLWEYVQGWDAGQSIPSYGESSAIGPAPGIAYLLLASDNITAATLPSGTFLGSYNVKIAPPIPDVAGHLFSFSLTPYPEGLTNASADRAPTSTFPQYAAGVSIGTLGYEINGVRASSASVHIGQSLAVLVPLLNSGTAPVENLSATLTYEPTSGGSALVAIFPLANTSIPSNGTSEIELLWNVTEGVVGDHGTVAATLVIEVVWNGGPTVGDGGSVIDSAPAQILPSYVSITGVPVYPNQLQRETEYTGDGTIEFNGTGLGVVLLVANPMSGGPAIQLASANSSAGGFALEFNSSALQQEELYTFVVNTSYNTAFAPQMTLPGMFSLLPALVPMLTVDSITLSSNGTEPANTVRIGETLGIQVDLLNVGTGPTSNISGIVLFVPPFVGPAKTVAQLPLVNVSIAAGASRLVNFKWTVTESVVGEIGPESAFLSAEFAWNAGIASMGGGSTNATVPLHVDPSNVRIQTFLPYPSILQNNTVYTSTGTILFNGSGMADIELIATPDTGVAFMLAQANAPVGSFNLTFSSSRLLVGVTYNLSVEAAYNTASAPSYGSAGSVSLATAGSSASSTSLWLWVAIGASALIAILLAVVLLRRRGSTESQECGECGALVSAGERSCSRCGTWFATEPVPCPTCGAAIPADATHCPECATEAPDRPRIVPASEADRQGYEEFVSHYRAAAAGELGEDYPETEFWAWWKQQPSYYSFRAWKRREERDTHPVDTPPEREPSDEEVF